MHDGTAEIAAQNGAFPILRTRGRPRKGSKKSDVTTFIGRGRDYNLARLARDRPDLAVRVRAGTLSANGAAVLAGFRRKAERKTRRAKLVVVEGMIG
jgi:hypothetical protein